MALQAQQTSKNCHFLSLPGELRNIVYEYALTEEHGIQCVTGNDGMDRFHVATTPWRNAYPLSISDKHSTSLTSEEQGPEADQLKLVNHQLYIETRGLIFKYNNVSFRDESDATRFLDNIPSSRYVHLRELTIHGTGDPAAPNTDQRLLDGHEKVKDFARRNPHVLIRYTSPYPGPIHLFLICAARAQILRLDCDDLFMNGVMTPSFPDLLRKAVIDKIDAERTKEYSRNTPPNCRLCFRSLDTTEEHFVQKFRAACLEKPRMIGILQYVDGGIDHWVTALRDVLRNGISPVKG